MAIKVKSGYYWVEPAKIRLNSDNRIVEPASVYANVAGVWKNVFTPARKTRVTSVVNSDDSMAQ